MTYRQVTENSCWVDDPASVSYNQWVENTSNGDWDSAEHLIDYTEQYAYGFVIGYNQNPIISGAGSAIFFHCGSCATAGCISASEDTVVTLLRWLDPAMSPEILIVNAS
ncbi:hypothetical protein OBV_04420 [Oscillibacter valericigenes Sjm18-20]|nr:hypothetical protein OBV_04420 [Oscillibacter valericigenes Sjm18-20]